MYIFKILSAPSSLTASHQGVDGFEVSFSSVPGASKYSVSVVARHNSSDWHIFEVEGNLTKVSFEKIVFS